MIPDMYFNFFSKNEDFPFHIQYGHHDEEMFIHTHADFSELVIILAGTATHIVDGEEYPLKKGDVFVINDCTAHGFKDTKNFRICNIMFDLSYFISFQNDIKTSPGFHALFVIEPLLTRQKGFQGRLTLTIEHFTEIKNLIEKMMDEYTNQPMGYQTMLTSLLSQMFTHLSRLYDFQKDSPESDVFSIANSVAHMENHFREELSIEVLSEMAGMSSRHFRRVFQNIYQTSPLKYIIILRIQAAMRLLSTTDLPVTEVAMRCGFSDGNYFSNKFKQSTGRSPMDYRKYARSDIELIPKD